MSAARINARAPIYTVTHGDIDLSLLFDTNGFMLEENVVSAKPRFHFIADKQNDISSIVVELDYPVNISDVSRVMENLLLESAEKLLRYKGMLWIEGEPNRLLFGAFSACTAPTGTARGATSNRTANWCLSALTCRKTRSEPRLRA